MEEYYRLFGSAAIWLVVFLLIGSGAYADETSRFNGQILTIQADRIKVESQLGVQDTYRPLSLFYVGMMGHYELEQQAVANAVSNVIQFYANVIKPVQIDRVRAAKLMEIQWLDTYPHASSYYDDLVDHYEQGQLMRDVIAQGI